MGFIGSVKRAKEGGVIVALCPICSRDCHGKHNCEFCGTPLHSKGTTAMQEHDMIIKDDTKYAKKDNNYGVKWAALASLISALLSFLIMPLGLPAIVMGIMGLRTTWKLFAILGMVIGLFTLLFYIGSILLISVGLWTPEFLSN
jgi:hypothetical protein